MIPLDDRTDLARSGRTLGEAANRYVTFRIVMGVVSLLLFLLFVFAFFMPAWHRFPWLY